MRLNLCSAPFFTGLTLALAGDTLKGSSDAISSFGAMSFAAVSGLAFCFGRTRRGDCLPVGQTFLSAEPALADTNVCPTYATKLNNSNNSNNSILPSPRANTRRKGWP